MFQVFIGYEGEQGKQIAAKFGNYLERCGINCFAASTDPRWIMPGHTLGYIMTKLQQSDVMVVVCIENTGASQNLKREIDYAIQNNILIIPFVKKGVAPPFNLEDNYWCQYFPEGKPWCMHSRMVLYILQHMETKNEAAPTMKQA